MVPGCRDGHSVLTGDEKVRPRLVKQAGGVKGERNRTAPSNATPSTMACHPKVLANQQSGKLYKLNFVPTTAQDIA